MKYFWYLEPIFIIRTGPCCPAIETVQSLFYPSRVNVVVVDGFQNKNKNVLIIYLDAVPHVVDVVMVRIGAGHVLGHDGHPVHQTSLGLRWRRRIVVVVVGKSRRRGAGRTVRMVSVVVVVSVMMMMRMIRSSAVVIVVELLLLLLLLELLLLLLLLVSAGRSSRSANANGSLCRCRRSSSCSAVGTGLGDMRMSCFRRRRPDERRFLEK